MPTPAEQICETLRRAYQRSLIATGEGNASIHLPEGGVLCTPAGPGKERLRPSDLCVVDLAGQQLSGQRRRSSEILMHLALYRAAPAVRAVLHTHAPYATTFAVLGEPPPRGELAEGEIFLGHVPLVPYATPGTAALGTQLALHVHGSVAALLANHGVVTWGPDLETTYLRMETLEAVCRVLFLARQIGTPKPIPGDGRAALDALRAIYAPPTPRAAEE
jgi:L-fuculose-phosphate aldolase